MTAIKTNKTSDFSEHIEQAAVWLARLQADDVDQQDHLNCQQWREQDPAHELAWQRINSIANKLRHLPKGSDSVLQQVNKSAHTRRSFLQFATLALVGGGATSLGLKQTHVGQSLIADYRTAPGETAEFALADGSQLTLNTNTSVDVIYNAEQRVIKLYNGEIQIRTAKDKQHRPLSVDTKFGQIFALGTEFNVRQFDNKIDIALLEGNIEVAPNNKQQNIPLAAGHSLSFNETGSSIPAPLDQTKLAWRKGKLVVSGMRLQDFATEISRYRKGIVRCSPQVADLKISGVFSTDNTDIALHSLTDSLPVKLDYRTALWVTIHAR